MSNEFKLVPLVPTEEMLVVMHDRILIGVNSKKREANILNDKAWWAAVVAAAPASPQAAQPVACWVHPSYLIRREGMAPMAIDATLNQIAPMQIPLYTRADAGEVERLKDFLPTPNSINALPEGIRIYVRDLQTLCDPSGIVAENTLLRDQTKQLDAMIGRLKREADTLRAQLAERDALLDRMQMNDDMPVHWFAQAINDLSTTAKAEADHERS